MVGAVVASSDGPLVMEVALPSSLREMPEVHVTADGSPADATVTAGIAQFVLPARAGSPVSFRIE